MCLSWLCLCDPIDNHNRDSIRFKQNDCVFSLMIDNENYSLSISSCIFMQSDQINALLLLANFVNESIDLSLCIVFHSHKLINRYAHTNDHNCTLLIAILFLIIAAMQAIRRGVVFITKLIKRSI